MGFEFLSDSWFDEAEKIRAEINPEVPAIIQDLVINLKVTGGPSGDVEAKMAGGKFVKGQQGDAKATLIVDYDVARKMFIENDQQAGMQAFMSGQIKVEGDMAAIMGMQAAGPPSDDAKQVSERILAMTD